MFIRQSPLVTAVFAFGLLLSAGCGGPSMPLDRSQSGADASGKLGQGTAVPANIMKVFEAHCLSCHAKGGGLPYWGELKTVHSKKDSLISRLEGRQMPPGGGKMTDDERGLVIKWLRSGAPGEAVPDAPGAGAGEQPGTSPGPGTDPGPANPPPTTEPSNPSADISFNGQISQIFTKHCSSCHEAGGMGAGMGVWSDYTQAKDKKDKIAERVGNGTMPPTYASPSTGMTDAEREVIKKWVAAGAPLDAAKPTEPTQPSSGEVTYTGQISQIFKKHCASCHEAGGMGAGMGVWSDYTQAQDKKDKIAERVGNGTMPPTYASPNTGMTDAERSLVKAWVAAGAPYEPTQGTQPSQPTEPTQPTVPGEPQPAYTYDRQMKTWFAHNCSICHDGQAPDMRTKDGRKLPNWQNFDEVQANLGLIKQRVFDEKAPEFMMPPYGITGLGVVFTDEQRLVLRTWLDAGAPKK